MILIFSHIHKAESKLNNGSCFKSHIQWKFITVLWSSSHAHAQWKALPCFLVSPRNFLSSNCFRILEWHHLCMVNWSSYILCRDLVMVIIQSSDHTISCLFSVTHCIVYRRWDAHDNHYSGNWLPFLALGLSPTVKPPLLKVGHKLNIFSLLQPVYYDLNHSALWNWF